MRRTGIDLSSTRCIIVDAESLPRRSGDRAGVLRVYRCASLCVGTAAGEVFTAELKGHLAEHAYPRRAWVNFRDLRSSHQYLLLPTERAAEFESIARSYGASALGLDDADVTVSIRVGAQREFEGRSKTEVSYFAAGTEDIRRRLDPLLQAGVVVEGVTTPCGALWSQATLRRAPTEGNVHAQVVLGESQSALLIFSGGSFLYGRDVAWGYSTIGDGLPSLNRDELAARLSRELRHSFLYVKQFWEEEVSQIVLCGDMPEIRSLVAPLIDRLSIEVETLDTLEGIDPASLPEGLADRAAAYRIASSIAAGPAPVNLLPVEFVTARPPRTLALAVAAATAAALGICAFLYGQANVARVEAERQLATFGRDVPYLDPHHMRERSDDGPSLVKLLTAFVNAVPNDVVVRSLRVSPDGDHWKLDVTAVADGGSAPPAPDSVFPGLPATFGRLREPVVRAVGTSGGGLIEVSASYLVRK